MATLATTTTLLQLFAEPTRLRLLALLGRQELTVGELTAAVEVAQSRASTHLGKLREAGIVRDRRVGASTYYALDERSMSPDARTIWSQIARRIEDGVLRADRARAEQIVEARARAWPEGVAGQMERYYSPGRTWESLARGLVGLVRLGDVLDGGSGDGTVAELLAPWARTITCLDVSETMLAAARTRLARFDNVRTELGDVQHMPAAARSFDQVLMLHVLAHTRAPARAIAEAARVLRPGGDLVLLTVDRHAHAAVGRAYGHVQPGFRPARVRRLLRQAGLSVHTCAVTSRDRRPPHFGVVTAFARKGGPS